MLRHAPSVVHVDREPNHRSVGVGRAASVTANVTAVEPGSDRPQLVYPNRGPVRLHSTEMAFRAVVQDGRERAP